MADTEDHDSRTEEPTEKKLSEAIEKGNVPFAREAVIFGSLVSIAAACILLARWATIRMTEELQSVLGNAGAVRLDDRHGAAILLTSLGLAMAVAILPVMAMVAGGSLVASLIQNVPSAVNERIAPRWSRISPGAGWDRLFGRAGLVEFAKSLIKLAAVSALVFFMLRGGMGGFLSLLQADPRLLPDAILRLTVELMVAFAMVSLLMAIADMVWSRFKWRHDLRMTRHDIKEEMKQAEGDPQLKARVRSIARQRSSRRMLTRLPKATVVITNPTHFAVALRYAQEQDGAPVVLAKGIDFMAMRIREIATSHDVPVIENKPLARALYDKVDIDREIPAEFYRAVAEIIQFLHNRKRIAMRPAAN